MDDQQQGAGRDQTEAEAKAEVRGVLISLELERRRRGLHLGRRREEIGTQPSLTDRALGGAFKGRRHLGCDPPLRFCRPDGVLRIAGGSCELGFRPSDRDSRLQQSPGLFR